jgi:hypothetical protein
VSVAARLAELRGDPRPADWEDLVGRTVVVEAADPAAVVLRVVGSERRYRLELVASGDYGYGGEWVPHDELGLEVSGP